MTSSSTIVLIVAWVFGAGRFGLSTTNLTSDEPQPQSYQTDIAGMSHLLLCTRGAGAALTMPVCCDEDRCRGSHVFGARAWGQS